MRNELTRRQLFEGGIEAAKKLPIVVLLAAACAPAPVRPSPPTIEARSREEQATLLNLLAGSIYFTTGTDFPSQGAFIKEDGKYFIYTNKATADRLKDNVRNKFATIAVVPITTHGLQFEVDPSKFIYEEGKDGALYPMDPLRPTIDKAIKDDEFTYLVRSKARLVQGSQVALPRPGDNSGRFNMLQLKSFEPDSQYSFDFSFSGLDCKFPSGACILRMDRGIVTKEIMGMQSGGHIIFIQDPARPTTCNGQVRFKPT